MNVASLATRLTLSVIRQTATAFLCAAITILPLPSRAASSPGDYHRVTVLDDETSRGVPLVELRTRNEVCYYTDSNGIAAIDAPDMMNRKVLFKIRSHGYRYEGAFYGDRGVSLDLKPGGDTTLKIHRLNIAERLYRATGAGIYLDSVLTSRSVPIREPLLCGGVTGQDTVIACPYNGKIFWGWGDTNGLESFNLSAAGATSEFPGKGGLDPSVGVNFSYFVNDQGFTKGICPFKVRGLKWIEGLTTVKDSSGRERLVARVSSMRGLSAAEAWVFAAFNDEKQEFEEVVRWDIRTPHRSAHPFKTNGRRPGDGLHLPVPAGAGGLREDEGPEELRGVHLPRAGRQVRAWQTTAHRARQGGQTRLRMEGRHGRRGRGQAAPPRGRRHDQAGRGVVPDPRCPDRQAGAGPRADRSAGTHSATAG